MALLSAAWCGWLKHLSRTEGVQLIKLLEPQVGVRDCEGRVIHLPSWTCCALNFSITSMYIEEIFSFKNVLHNAHLLLYCQVLVRFFATAGGDTWLTWSLAMFQFRFCILCGLVLLRRLGSLASGRPDSLVANRMASLLPYFMVASLLFPIAVKPKKWHFYSIKLTITQHLSRLSNC